MFHSHINLDFNSEKLQEYNIVFRMKLVLFRFNWVLDTIVKKFWKVMVRAFIRKNYLQSNSERQKWFSYLFYRKRHDFQFW